jgi:signal peptidase I
MKTMTDDLLFTKLTTDLLLNLNQPIRFRAKGHSMYPHILNGDILEIEPVDPKRIQRGDILFHVTPRKNLIAHRCIRIDHCIFYTKGDTAYGKGLQVRPEDILGRVRAIERNGNYISFQGNMPRVKNRLLASIAPQGAWLYPFLSRLSYHLYSFLLFLRGDNRSKNSVSIKK